MALELMPGAQFREEMFREKKTQKTYFEFGEKKGRARKKATKLKNGHDCKRLKRESYQRNMNKTQNPNKKK